MTIHTEKSPLTVGAVNEDNKSFDSSSVTTAYLSYQPDDTQDMLAAFSRVDLPRKHFAKIVVPIDSILNLLDGDVIQMRINPEEIDAHNIERQRVRRERDERRREALERKVSKEVYEKYGEEFERLDAEADKLYSDLNAKVRAEIESEVQRLEGNR